MQSMIRSNRFVAVCVLFLSLGASATAIAESISAGALHSRETGPSIAGQTSPAPTGGWSSSDDRLLNATINGQGGWTNVEVATRFDEEIATGIAHSGGHSWRLSNWYHSGYVNPLLTPQFASVGETTAINHDGPAGTAQTALSHHVTYEFWFRSAAPDDAHPDPGSLTSTTLSDAPGNRLTYFGIFDELPGPGGSAGNGCPGSNGCFHVDAVEAISGNDPANDGDASYLDHYSAPLTRGVWYRVHIDATFVDGPGAITTDATLCPASTVCHTGNDQIHYQVFDGNGAVVFDTGVIGSWEAAYFDGRYGNAVGTVTAPDYVGFRVASNADGGSQPYGTNSVTNRPRGAYFDDLKVVPDSGAGFQTSFDTDRYVATSGADTGSCGVAATPCKTITYAIAQSNPYDTVHVAAGVYAENSGAGQNLVINKPVAIEGAQTGVDARTRSLASSLETVLVPAVVDPNLTLDSLGHSAVVTIASDGVSLDGLIVDGDNPNLSSPSAGAPISLNGANPDADSAIFASGNGITLQNLVLRNVGGSGVLGSMNSGTGGDNTIQYNRFTNITNPSTWGIGIYAGDNFYAQIRDNLMDQVRVGMQIENNSAANPGAQAPSVLRNEIHATRTALFDNLFYGSASTYTFSGNTLVAAANAGQTGQWTGMQIESMGDSQTVVIQNNQIDATALASSRLRVGYLINNWTSSLSATTAIDGGTVGNVDAGVLVTDASNYTGPVNGALVQNVAFNAITLGAIYIEDTNEVSGAPAVTIGAGNTYTGVSYRLALAGAAPQVSFSGVSGADSVRVRAAGNFLFGKLDSSGPCSVAQCTLTNASINTAIAAANPGATVYVEPGTFDEMPTIGASKTGLRLTAIDPANPPVLTRLSGGPNQPVLVVNGARSVMLDHLHVTVDKKHAAEGILANGFIDGLNIHDNAIVQTVGAEAGATASYKYTNGISINIDPAHNSLGFSQSDGANAIIQNNVISASTGANATTFRAGIAMDRGVGTISSNTSTGLNHDAIVRFCNTVAGGPTAVLISGNTFNGGGLEFDAPTAGVAPITFSNNVITAAAGSAALSLTQTQLEADISVLRLIDNAQSVPVSVSNNQLLGYARGYRGATVQNFPAATFSGNTFTPLAGASDFVSLVVSNKEINANNPPQAPYPMSITALHNAFNGSGISGAGRAVEFIDDNDANGSAAFGALLFGSSQASDANTFDANHGLYFNLVYQRCDTNLAAVGGWPGGVSPQCTFLDYNDVNAPGGLVNTQVRPFRANVRAANNLYAGVAPAAMGATQRAALFTQTFDVNDNSALGLVDYGLGAGVQLSLDGPLANVQATVPVVFTGEVANAGPTPGENVVVHLALSSDRAGGIQAGDINAQYFDSASNSYLTLPLTLSGGALVVDFGPGSGFPIAQGYDITTNFRFTFNYANGAGGSNYTASGSVVGVSTHTIYAVDVHQTNVVQTPAHIALALAGPASVTAAVASNAYSARILNAGGATGENVLVHFAIARSGGIGSADLTVQYYDGSSYQSIPLLSCNAGAQLCGTFGPPSGFAVGVGYDATTPLQLTFARSGAFTVQASVDGLSTTTYASTSLAVNVSPGAATTLAPFGPTSFSGIAGAALNTTPVVIATDAGGNPVAGVVVTFAAGASSGTVSGASQTTDAAGIATLGGWTLAADPGVSDTLTASAAGLSGSPVGFSASGAAQYELTTTVTPSRHYVQYGHTLDYVIVVSNAGPSNASAISVQSTLTSGLTTPTPTWFCSGSSGATCTSGSGTLLDSGVTIPAGGSVTYVLSLALASAPGLPSDVINHSVSISAPHMTNANAASIAAPTVQLVIYRDGFEVGGDGAQNGPGLNRVQTLDAGDTATLATPDSVNAAQPAIWFRAVDSQGREVLRGEVSRIGSLQVRLISTDAAARESIGNWNTVPDAVSELAFGFAAGKSGESARAQLLGQQVDLGAALPAWAQLPLSLYLAQ